MTTATEHHDQQLAAIKARHEALADKFRDPAVTRIDDGLDFGLVTQVGLSMAYVDELGRFWKLAVVLDPRRVVAEMVFDPRSLLRPIVAPEEDTPEARAFWAKQGYAVRDADDTQAAQGFPAKEDGR